MRFFRARQGAESLIDDQQADVAGTSEARTIFLAMDLPDITGITDLGISLCGVDAAELRKA